MAKSEYIVDVSESTFEFDVISPSHRLPVIVDFWAQWCAPCRMLGPLLEKLAQESRGAFRLAKVNVDENPNLAVKFSVRNIPAVKAFREGKIVAEFQGAQPEARVREFVRNIAPSEEDRLLQEAGSLLAIRHWPQAESAYRRVLTERPQSAATALGLIKALLAQGKGCEAEELIDNFPSGNEVVSAEKLRPLAHLLCEVETPDPPVCESDLDTMYYQAARLFGRGLLEAGLDGLLGVLRQDKKYRKGEPRQVILGVFELLGEDDPRTRRYRNELASVLY